jgi:hypothetical protein
MDIDEQRLQAGRGNRETAELSYLCIARNIVSIIKQWKDFHIGRRTLKLVTQFLTRMQTERRAEKIRSYLPAILRAIAELQSGSRHDTQDSMDYAKPVISNPLLLHRLNINVLDPDPLEVARQITLIYHEKYESIHSLEFIIGISNRRTTIQTPTLAEFFGFGDSLTLLFAEAFLISDNREAAFRRMVEIVKCLAPVPTNTPQLELNSMDAVACILRFLVRPDVLRLGGASQGQAEELQELWRRSGEGYKHSQGVNPYDEFIGRQFNGWKPTIPNMHAELKSGDKALGREPEYLNGLINWGKLRPQAKRCVILNRFQMLRYKFLVIPQIQKIILKGPELTEDFIEERLDELMKL